MWNNESWVTLNAMRARAGDAGLPTAAAPRAARPSLAMQAMQANIRQGILEVAFARPQGYGPGGAVHLGSGAIEAALYSLSGVRLAEASGIQGGSPIRFARPSAGPGVYLLKARARGAAGNTSVTLRVCF